MATTIQFNGRTTAIPGSYSEVDASGLAKVGVGATGIIAVIGEASGGVPYSAADADFEGFYRISNPGKVARVFREGDLLEAGSLLFDATKDPNIPSSAQEVLFVKVNPSTPSTRTIYDATGAIWGVVSSKDYGLHTTQLALDIEDGTDGGKLVTVWANYDGAVEEYDNVGATAWFTVTHRIPASLGGCTVTQGATTFTGTLSLDAGLVFTADTGTLGTITSNGCTDEPTGAWAAGSVATLVSDNVADIGQSVIVYGVVGGVAASETIILNGTTPVSGASTFTKIHGVYKPATTGNVAMSRAGPVAFESYPPALTWGGCMVRATDGQLEVNKGSLAFSAEAATTKTLLVLGSSGGSPAMEIVTLNGTTPVSTTTIDWDYIVAVFGYEVENARTVTMRGMLWADDTEASLVSSSTSDNGVEVLVFGKDEAGALASELVTLGGTTPVVTDTAWDIIYGFMVADQDDAAFVGTVALSTAAASIVVKGASMTSFNLVTAAAASKSAGRIKPLGWHVGGGQSGGGTALTYNLAGLTGDNGVIYMGEDANGDFQGVSKAAGTAGATTEVFTRLDAICFEGGIGGSVTAAQSIVAWTLTNSAFASLQAVADFFDAFEGVTFTLVTTKASTLDLDDLDQATTVVDASTTTSFYGVGYDVAKELNDKSAYVEVALGTTTFKGGPLNGSGMFLRGGTEGSTAFADWQAALDMLKGFRVNTIVPLTSDSAVHAACVTHATYMAGAGRSERDVVLGADSAETLAQLKTRARELNTRHARLCIQDVTRYNTSGVKEQFPPYFSACLAAGMQSGAAVGEPLTWKYLNAISIVGNDTSYTIVDDLDEIIQAGLHAIEPVPNIGYRWARGVTTYLIDDNLAYIEASTNNAVNLAVYEFRRAMEAVVGRRGFDGTVAAAQGIAVAILGQLFALGYITSWQNLAVTLEDDVMTVDVEIAPVNPVNFVKNTLHLVPASFAAAA